MELQKLSVSGFAYRFEKRCKYYEESDENKKMTDLMLGSDIAKMTGYYWENTVYNAISEGDYCFFKKTKGVTNNNGRVIIHDGKDVQNKDKGDIVKAITNFIEGNDEYCYLKQYTLSPSNLFYKKPYIGEVLKKTANIKLKPGNCDLIYLYKDEDGKYKLCICDIKASLKVKLYHKIQIEIYYEFLESMLEDAGISDICSISEYGYIWTRATNHPEGFERRPIRKFLNEYFRTYDEIKKEDVDESLPGDVRYMNSRRCEGCVRVDECIERAINNKMELILSPGISEKDVINLAKNTDIACVQGLQKLYDDIKSSKAYKKNNKDEKSKETEKKNKNDLTRMRSCRYFNRMYIRNTNDYNELKDYLDIWKSDNKKFKLRNNISHPDLSKEKEDVNIFLSAQYEQFSNTIPVFAICKTQAFCDPEISVFVAKDISRESVDTTFGVFVSVLSDILRDVDKNKLTIQGFTEDGIEIYCLEKALYEYVNRSKTDERIKNDASLILTWIRSEKTLAKAPNVGYLNNHSGDSIKGNLLQIDEIVNRLLLMNAYISCELGNICECFGIDHIKDQEIFNRFNGNIKESFLYKMYFDSSEQKARSEADGDLVKKLEESLKIKFKAENKVINCIRDELTKKSSDSYEEKEEEYILDQRKHYKLPSLSTYDLVRESDYIDRFRYMIYSEADIAKRQIRDPRLRGLQEAYVKRQFIRLKYVGTFYKNKIDDSGKSGFIYKYEDGKRFILHISKKKSDIDSNTFIGIPGFTISEETGINYEQESNCRETDKWHLFKVDDHIKKMFRAPALVMEKNFYKFVPMWNGEYPGASTNGTKIFDINYVKDRRYHWLYDEKTNTRTDFIMVQNIVLEDVENRNCIIFGTYDEQNDIKNIDFLNDLKRDKLLRESVEKTLGYVPLNKRENGEIESLFIEDLDKQRAYESFCNNKVSAVIGPPGTGKTYFISVLLKNILNWNKDKKFRILLTSNSWAAIDNMMNALENEMKNMKEREDFVYDQIRLDSNAVKKDETIKIINEKNNPVIIGATVWQIYNICYKKDNDNKIKCENLQFDLIIIDEATQLRMVDALIPVSRLKSSGKNNQDDGKLVVVGDDDQLGSIIMGNYEVPENKEKLYGSVFGYFYDRFKNFDKDASNVTQLNQCRRMNEVITRYLADGLYGDRYKTVKEKSFNKLILSSELTDKINTYSVDEEPLAHILAPDYQLTVCYLECDENDAYDINNYEIELTSDLALLLQQNIRDKDMPETAVKFMKFWGNDITQNDTLEDSKNEDLDQESDDSWNDYEGMIGIISPYNRLNEDISERISKKYDGITDDLKDILGIMEWNSERISDNIRCSTVDKFQGQERDIIITCYGERDVDSLLLIKDFVYNSNRLNVAMSRAKKKCIIIMSDNLAKRHQECYEDNNERIIKGSEFICCLKDYMKEETPSDEFGEYKQRDYYFDYMIPNKEEKNTGKRKKNEKQESDTKDKKVRIHVYQKGYNPKQTE